MVIDPTQINAMQQGSIGGIGIGMAGAYGQALPGYTGWQPFIPQGFFGGQLGQPLGMAMSPSIFATPQLGGQLTDYWGLLSNL
ncbi:MAG TPA: hypothetical protein VGX03_03855, partial [Candidatus Binatia bacterium]|nr:hypothetical protein [Candidatus Binatia bacterium]